MKTADFIKHLPTPKKSNKSLTQKIKGDLHDFHDAIGSVFHKQYKDERMDLEAHLEERQQAPTGAIEILI